MGLPELKRKLSKKKVLGILIFVVIGILAIFSFAQEDVTRMMSILGSANKGIIVLAFVLQVLFLLSWAKRWGVSLGALGTDKKVTSLFPIIFGSKFVNNVTPFSYAGGDFVVRSYLLRQVEGTSYVDGFASSVAEYVPDFMIFAVVSVLSLILSVGKFGQFQIIFISGFGLGFLALLIYALRNVTKSGRGIGGIERFVSWISSKIGYSKTAKEIHSKISLFGQRFRGIFNDFRTVVKISLLSILIWVINLSILYGLFLSFGIVPPLPSLFLAMTLPMIVGMIPITIGGLGTMDATRAGVLLCFMPHHSFVIANVILLRRLVGFVFTTIAGGSILSLLGFKIWRD